jgi:lysophospholipase L1-like esterase
MFGMALALCAPQDARAEDFGKLVFVGDSITHGGRFGGYVGPSYRYQLWQHAVDSGASFTPVGALAGAYESVVPLTPDYKSNAFVNVHEGHSGWLVAWSDGRIPLPSWAYNTKNLGSGTAQNWTAQTTTFATADVPSPKTYTGTTYVPDTVVVMMGINDLAGVGSTASQTESDLKTLVQQYQAANANVRVYVASVLPIGTGHAAAATINPKVATLDTALSANAAGWSTGTSTVSYIDVRDGFDPNKMTSDNVHLNYVGERIVARNFAAGLGLGARDNTIGLGTRKSQDLTTEFNGMSALPGVTAGAPLYRVGTGWSGPGAGESWISLSEPAGGATSLLRSDWDLETNEPYTIEARLKIISGPSATNDFVIWSDDGTAGAKPGFLRIYEGKTVWGYSAGPRLTIDVSDNTDAFHEFRVSFNGSTYAVWRDGQLIADGLDGDIGAGAQNWLTLGNYTANESTNALLDYVGIEVGTAFAVPEPATIGLGGCGAAALLMARRHSRRKNRALSRCGC